MFSFTVVNVNLVPDFNHDRVIDASDVTTNTLHFWINDDANSGDISSGDDDVPGQSGGTFGNANYSFSHVCGRNDLQDFFPVWLDLNQVLNLFPPGGSIQYLLKQADGAVKIVYSDLTKAQAGDYLTVDGSTYGTGFSQTSYEADTVTVPANGLTLDTTFLNKIKSDAAKGVLLVEGAGTTTAPLVLEVWLNGQKIASAVMPLQTSTISQMYRWINLRGVTGGSVTLATATNQPPNYPDALCNGKQFVYAHGAMAPESCARSGAAQLFKRLYHAGSRAMFTMVAWEGDTGTIPETCYHEDVRNAFAVASNYVVAVSQLPGQLYVGAHSLGNMLVSSAIADHGLNPQNYFMFNAAVAAEAYNGGVSNIVDMVPTDWTPDYDRRLWASDWCNRFSAGDARHDKLTWRTRFGNIPQAISYYSSGEDLLANNPSGSDLSLWNLLLNYVLPTWLDSQSGMYQIWIFQERNKGRSCWTGSDDQVVGGWEKNSYYSGLSVAQANALASSNSVMQTNSFFNPFAPSGLYTTNGSSIAASNNVRAQLLAEAIPAISCATGGNSIDTVTFTYGQGNIDMSTARKRFDGLWPTARADTKWLHADFKDVAYYYVYRLFDDVVAKGSLK